jgi:hypothetical protein
MNSGGLEEKVLKERVEHENSKMAGNFKGKAEASGSGSKSPRGKHPKPTTGGKLTYEIVELPLFVDKMKRGRKPVELVGNKWQTRGTTQNEEILRNEAFNVYRGILEGTISNIWDFFTEFLESKKGKEWIKKMEKKFNYGLFDTWDFGAQYIFFLLGIPKENVVAFNKISLLSYQMEYAGTFKHLPKNVPGENGKFKIKYNFLICAEVYSAQIGDAIIKRNFEAEHQKNMKVFTKVHREMVQNNSFDFE